MIYWSSQQLKFNKDYTTFIIVVGASKVGSKIIAAGSSGYFLLPKNKKGGNKYETKVKIHNVYRHAPTNKIKGEWKMEWEAILEIINENIVTILSSVSILITVIIKCSKGKTEEALQIAKEKKLAKLKAKGEKELAKAEKIAATIKNMERGN